MSADGSPGFAAASYDLCDDDRQTNYDVDDPSPSWCTPGASELLAAFAAIADTGVRRAVLHLVETMAKAGPKPRRRPPAAASAD